MAGTKIKRGECIIISLFTMQEIIMSKDFQCDKHWRNQIELCLHIAVEAHHGQVDKVGLPVILHPLEVAKMGETPMEVCVGFLHDTIEDTDITAEALLNAGVDSEIVECVKLLTHDKTISYNDYVQSIIDSDNPVAISVKYNDLTHNAQRAETYGFDKQLQKCVHAMEKIRVSSLASSLSWSKAKAKRYILS